MRLISPGDRDRNNRLEHPHHLRGIERPALEGPAAAEFLTPEITSDPGHSGATVPDFHRVPRTATLMRGTLLIWRIGAGDCDTIMSTMSPVQNRSDLTSARGERRRPRLRIEFSSMPRRRSAPLREGAGDVELSMERVSAALTSEAAIGALGGRGSEPDRAAPFERRLGDALDADLDTLGTRLKKTARSREALLRSMLDAALDPATWRAIAEDVGRCPTVSVLLYLPGSLARATRAQPLDDVDVTVVFRGLPRAGEDIDRLADAMTPPIPVPTAPVVLQARRNAVARTELMNEFGVLTSAQVAELAGSEAKNTSALAGRWRREGRLIAVDHQGTTYYPGFQLDPEGRPRPVVADVLSHLSQLDTTPWQQALWFMAANGWLDGRRPVDLLDDQPGAVVSAAEAAVREPVG
jgi:hypothetical protein